MTETLPLQRHGHLSYFEIPALDVQQSASFYESVFGWNIRGEDHRSFDDPNGDIIGGWVTGRPSGGDGGVLPFIYVNSIDEIVVKIADRGGEIVEQIRVEGESTALDDGRVQALWVARFRDPAGNLMGVWQVGVR